MSWRSTDSIETKVHAASHTLLLKQSHSPTVLTGGTCRLWRGAFLSHISPSDECTLATMECGERSRAFSPDELLLTSDSSSFFSGYPSYSSLGSSG